MLLKQLSKERHEKERPQKLTIDGFPINQLLSLCDNEYLGLYALVIILDPPRRLRFRLEEEEMLKNVSVDKIWVEYHDLFKLPLCERLLSIVNGVYRITNKKVS